MATARLVWIMAAACGIGVANIYYNQPLLARMGADLGGNAAYLPVFTQIGVGFGMFLFVPLGDMFERRRLITIVCCAASIAAALTALASNLPLLAAASALLGVTSIAPHLILPFAAQIAAPEERGRVVGTVLGGLLTGILLARTASGLLGAHFGWRLVYWVASALMSILAVVLAKALPASHPAERLSYPALLRSLAALARTQPLLREASAIGGLLFGAFSAFWSTLIYRLGEPPYHYGEQTAGLFGLIGMAGAAAAPLAGRLTDRRGPRFAVGVGIAIAAAAYLVFWLAGGSFAGLIAGVILLDLGVQGGHVSNQTRIYGIDPAARSRLNTVYMVTYFTGGACGSALAAFGWNIAKWDGVCAAGALLAAAAWLVHASGKKDKTHLEKGRFPLTWERSS